MQNEIKVWEKLDHENVVKIFELIDDDSDKNSDMYLIMQYSDLGELAKWDNNAKVFIRNEKIYQKAFEAGEMKYLEDGLSDIETASKYIFR